VAATEPGFESVLAFWFGEVAYEAAVLAANSARWFRADRALDAEIGGRFGALRDAAVDGKLAAWLATPRGTLALIVLVDQFSRNLFRGDPQAFEHDALARSWTERMLDSGADRELRLIERVFAYLPLEHSESLADQERSVALFRALQDEAPRELRESFAGFLDYAERHRAIIARFGRFPHRNAVLGRASTDAELAFLEEPGSSF
jgi:uncharacterized protein (DUF924 family)